jgi:hypothetical protein
MFVLTRGITCVGKCFERILSKPTKLDCKQTRALKKRTSKIIFFEANLLGPFVTYKENEVL